ncbi:hypothetical protein JCM11641_005702 [Rhodosporidiobolus odoratus]
MLRLTVALVLLASTTSVLAQSADTVYNEQITLSTLIPATCTADCDAWRNALAACPGDADPTYQACACDATLQTNLGTCSACFSTNADENAGTADTAVTDLANFCGGAAASTSSTDSTSSSTTDAATSSSPTPVTVASTTTSSSTSDSATSAAETLTTSMLTQAGVIFPTQTKSANVFAGAAAPGVKVEWKFAATLLGAVAGGMMFF